MVDANFVLNLVETIGILIGVTIGIIEIRNIREERQNQLIDQTLENFGRTEIIENWIKSIVQDFSSLEEWREKYGPHSNPEAAKYMYTIWSYYNALGKHLRDGLIDANYIDSENHRRMSGLNNHHCFSDMNRSAYSKITTHFDAVNRTVRSLYNLFRHYRKNDLFYTNDLNYSSHCR